MDKEQNEGVRVMKCNLGTGLEERMALQYDF